MRRLATRNYLAVALAGACALGFFMNVASAADIDPARKIRVAKPTVKIFQGEKCVEPTEDMRRNHMNYILHQRDDTVHKGIRTSRHSLKTCINCHADPATNSVLGKTGFCESCHTYTAVSMDCFSCHASSPEKTAKSERDLSILKGLVESGPQAPRGVTLKKSP